MMCRVGWRKGRPTATPRRSASPCNSPIFCAMSGKTGDAGGYLPLEDLDRFGYTERDLALSVVDERFVALMRFEIERARRLYESPMRDGLHPEGETFP